MLTRPLCALAKGIAAKLGCQCLEILLASIPDSNDDFSIF
jgi:hypothetical protein